MQPQPHDSADRRRRRAGFTLVEMLIAMLVLSIGIMATLQMQFISLNGAMIARDNANSADLARSIIDVMRTEATQWRDGSITADVEDSAFSDSAFISSPVLASVSGGWAPLFNGPVDARLTYTGNTRYCAYARGSYLEDNSVFVVQIAVVFPSANNSFPSSGSTPPAPAFTCPGDHTDKLDKSMNPEANDDALQREGFQVQFFGAHLTRNDHL